MAKVPVTVPGNLNGKGAGRCVVTGEKEGAIEARTAILAMWADRIVIKQNINPQAGHSNPAKMVQDVAILPRAGVVMGTTRPMDIKPGTKSGGRASPGIRCSPAGEGGRRPTDFRVNLAGIVTGS